MSAPVEKLVLALGADEKFALPLAVTLYGAVVNLGSCCTAEIYLVDGGLTPATRRRIAQVVATVRDDIPIHFLTPNLALLEGMPVANIGPMTYLRLLLPDTLPAEVAHVIYLDSDLMIRGSLAPLTGRMPQERAIAACREISAPDVSAPRALPNWRELGLRSDTPYFNAGLLIMNLRRWRTEQIARHILEYCAANQAINRYADQDGLNALLANDCELLPPQWNVPAYIESTSLLRMLSLDHPYTLEQLKHRETLLATSPVIHFIGARKPWARGLGLRSQQQWLRQAHACGWFSRFEFARFAAPLLADCFARRAMRSFREVARSLSSAEPETELP